LKVPLFHFGGLPLACRACADLE
jgi:hypothetical protein